MSISLLLIVCAISVIVTGVIAGVFFTFSDFVMKALRAATPEGGIEAMQVINRKVYGSAFLVMLLGMAVLALILSVYAFVFVPGVASLWIFAGCGLYGVGVFAVTIVCNVPMNKRLDTVDSTSEEGATYWRTYNAVWTGWNHVRTLASAGSMFCLFMACLSLWPLPLAS